MDQQTKAALKRSDYSAFTENGIGWTPETRRRAIVGGAILLALIAVAAIAIAIYSDRSAKASSAFGAAMQTYQTPLAAAGQQVPPGLKTFGSAADRARAASQQFALVGKQYGMTPDGRNARYFEGLSDMESGQTASAETILKQVANSWNSELGGLGKLALAQLYRGTARGDQAVGLYEQLTKKPTVSVPAGVAQLQLAELYESENKVDQARKIYAELKDKDSKGAAGVIAAQKLNPSAAPPAGGAPSL